MLEDRQLRQDLILKGKERVRLFTWDRAARETLDVYREVIEIGD
jgi:glycosyltransferase involved in cell wall biosynthesis